MQHRTLQLIVALLGGVALTLVLVLLVDRVTLVQANSGTFYPIDVPAPEIVYPWEGEAIRSEPGLELSGVVKSGEELTVRIWDEGTLLGQTRSEAWNPTMGINWTVVVTLTGDGPHPLCADAVSDSGLVSACGPTRTFTLDTQPPTVTLASLPPFTNSEGILLTWQGDDGDGSGVAAYGLEHQLGGGSWVVWTSGGETYTATPFGLYPEGVHGFRVWALDAAGHVGQSEEQTVAADRTPPAITLTLSERSPCAHVSGDTLYYYISCSGTFTATTTLADPLSGLAQVTFPDATGPGATYTLSGTASTTSSHVYNFDGSNTFNGTVVVTTTDRATNSAGYSFKIIRGTWCYLPLVIK